MNIITIEYNNLPFSIRIQPVSYWYEYDPLSELFITTIDPLQICNN